MKVNMLILASFISLSNIGNQVLADEISFWQPNDSTPDPVISRFENERHARTGVLIVDGELVTSPCTLEKNEYPLSSTKSHAEDNKLEILLTGCGDGASYTAPIYADAYSRMSTESSFISVFQRETGVMAPNLKLLGGDNLVYVYFSEYQKKLNLQAQNNEANSSHPFLLLKLKYQ